jgi:hypothetical protein
MSKTATASEQFVPRPVLAPESRRRWSWPQYLALIALPLLAHEAWTLVAWIADGPHQVTKYRDRDSASWYVAHVLEVLIVAISLAVIVYVVRGCLRERRVLTFDAMYCMAGLTLFYQNYGVNFIHPTFLNSSNWINLNNPCGHMPGVVNPDCGRVVDAILFWVLVEGFGLLALAVFACGVARRARSRWPEMSNRKLLGLTLGLGFLIDAVFELGVVLPLRLYAYVSLPGPKLDFGSGFRYPLIILIPNGLWLGAMLALRVFKDDRGRSFLERGVEHYSPTRQKTIIVLAFYSAFQLILWVGNGAYMVLGFYQGPLSPKLPAHVINGVCDVGAISGTRYGPCPGSPGYRTPGRGSLPGRSP